MTNEERNLEALHIHIEGLQATLTKRNARIAELQQQVAALKINPVSSAAGIAAYKNGWAACANRLQEITRQTAQQLRDVNKAAFRLYLEGEKIDQA